MKFRIYYRLALKWLSFFLKVICQLWQPSLPYWIKFRPTSYLFSQYSAAEFNIWCTKYIIYRIQTSTYTVHRFEVHKISFCKKIMPPAIAVLGSVCPIWILLFEFFFGQNYSWQCVHLKSCWLVCVLNMTHFQLFAWFGQTLFS